MFTTRQVAWLRARLPATVESEMLAPVIRHEPSPDGGDTRDALLVGRRKPFLNSVTHAARIKKHSDEFWHLVDDLRRDPALPPEVAGQPCQRGQGTRADGQDQVAAGDADPDAIRAIALT
jgi:hypothetical protein